RQTTTRPSPARSPQRSRSSARGWPRYCTRCRIRPAADLGEARRRLGQGHLGNARPQQIVEFEHPRLDLRQGPGPVGTVAEAALQALTEHPVFLVHLHVDAVAEPAYQAHLAPLVAAAEGCAADQSLARTTRQDLKEVDLLGHDVDAEVRQAAVEAPAATVRLGQVRLGDRGHVLLVNPLAPARGGSVAHPAETARDTGDSALVLVVRCEQAVEAGMADGHVIGL